MGGGGVHYNDSHFAVIHRIGQSYLRGTPSTVPLVKILIPVDHFLDERVSNLFRIEPVLVCVITVSCRLCVRSQQNTAPLRVAPDTDLDTLPVTHLSSDTGFILVVIYSTVFIKIRVIAQAINTSAVSENTPES